MNDKVERYKVLSAKVSLQVLAKRTQLDDAIRKYERQYFLKHGHFPKHNPSYTDLIKERNLAKGVLKTLNIATTQLNRLLYTSRHASLISCT